MRHSLLIRVTIAALTATLIAASAAAPWTTEDNLRDLIGPNWKP